MPRNSKRSSSSGEIDLSHSRPSRKRIRLSLCPENGQESSNVKVVARVRPLSSLERGTKAVLDAKKSSILLDNGGGDKKTYEYDAVFGPQSTQAQVYEESGAKQAVCRDILQGFNSTILAYGQTGSGKTFTMGTGNEKSGTDIENQGVQEMDGIIPRAVYDLFAESSKLVKADVSKFVAVDMSFLEIYNEEARDLLCEENESSNLHIREGSNGEVFVQNLTWSSVTSHSEVAKHMHSAADRRVVASTQMNSVSSRSHAICTLRVTVTDVNNNDTKVTSKLTLVDLAGSERIKKTGAEGSRLKEGININKGLFVLGQVVSCLSEIGQKTSKSHLRIPPYRDSKLTRLLQDSLGGNSRTIMVACVSPAESNVEESANTLRYASRARNIQNSATKNIIETHMPAEVAAALKKENFSLRQKVIQLEAQLRSTSSLILQEKKDGASLSKPDRPIPFLGHHDSPDLRRQMIALQTKVVILQEQASHAAQDLLQASLSSDRLRLQLQEAVDVAAKNGVEIQPAMLSLGLDDSHSARTMSLVEELRAEVGSWKAREAEARLDAEVARATAASVISQGGDLQAVEESILDIHEETENLESLEACQQDESSLAAELQSVNGNIEKKEEIVRKTILERQCLEALKSKFEEALQSLQDEVETISSEKKELEAIVESGSRNNPETAQMRRRIKALEKRITDLRSKANEHQKSLRLREMAERRCSKLEAEISQDKKRKADLQRRLKEESMERRRDKQNAKLQAARLIKDSQKLKHELQKVKMAADRQSLVLRRKTTELNNKLKRQAMQKRKQKKGSESLSIERKEVLDAWLTDEIQASLEISKTKDQIASQEVLLDEALLGMTPSDTKLDSEAEMRGSIIDQLQKNLKSMNASFFKDMSTWNELSDIERTTVVHIAVEKLGLLQLETRSSEERQKKAIDKAVAAVKLQEGKDHEENILKLRIEHADAMAQLLDSTRMVFKEDAKCGTDSRFQLYFDSCDAANKNIKAEIEQVKEHRVGMQGIVDQLAKDILKQNDLPAKKKKGKQKANKRMSFEDFNPMEESFIFEEVDDGNDSDWSPEDEKAGVNKENEIPGRNSREVLWDKENSLQLDNLKVSELKDRLRGYGLKVSGKKEDLRARLQEFMSKQQSHEPQSKITERPKRALRSLDLNNTSSFKQDTKAFSAKRILNNDVKLQRRRKMTAAVSDAMMELAKL